MTRIIDQGVEHAFGKIEQLLGQSKAAEAAQVAIDALQFHHNNPDILRQLGVAYMIMGHYQDAETTMLLSIHEAPENASGYEQIGNFYTALRRDREAADNYKKALERAPDSTRIQTCLRDSNRRIAQQQTERIQQKPKRTDGLTVAAAMEQLLDKKDIQKARAIVERVLDHDKDDLEALNLLATITLQLMDYEAAETLIKRAIELRPGSATSHSNLGFCYQRQYRFEDAVKCLNKAILLDPQNTNWHYSLGNIFLEWGKDEEAKSAYEKALQIAPDNANALLAYGLVLQDLGEEEATLKAFRDGISKYPNMGEFYFSLANLKTFRFEANEIDDMQFHILDESITDNSKVALNFALGKAFEDTADYKMAFHYFKQGNDKKRSMVEFDAQEFVELTDSMIETFDVKFFAERQNWGNKDPSPILIVGLPRSGSTLVEQILASHSRIDGTKELPDLRRVANSTETGTTAERRYPHSVMNISSEAAEVLGQSYIDRTHFHRKDAPFFTDKFPNNFINIGFLHLILPNAKVIDARRHPIDTCLSTWKQLFGMGQMFSYSLEDLAVYYRQYVRIMNHWDKVLPGKVLRCQYEDVVDDLEGSARKLLSHCELDWEDAVTRYYETNRVAKTASSEQVKKPIYTSAKGFWHNYEPWLKNLIEDLGSDLDITQR